MKKVTIWANCLVKNEERWIWYCLNSILPYVNKIIVWDSGSSDNTVKIITSIKSNKIIFKEIGPIGSKEFGNVRNKMFKKTRADWIIILDGDEVWPKSTITQVITEIKNAPKDIETFCVKPINFVGDLEHIHPDTFAGPTPHGPKSLKGFYSSRIFRTNIKGLHADGEYGKEDFKNILGNTLISTKAAKFLPKIYYWHMSYLPRSSFPKQDREVMMRSRKRKFEIGIKRPKYIEIPKLFYKKRPEFVKNPFYKMNCWETCKSVIQTPLKKIKRKILGWQPNQ